jgi:hypothetical protein
MAPTSFDTHSPRSSAISRKQFQNSSSRLILVLWPHTTIERFSIVVDLMALHPVRFGVLGGGLDDGIVAIKMEPKNSNARMAKWLAARQIGLQSSCQIEANSPEVAPER